MEKISMAPDMHKTIRVEKISMAKGLQGKTHTHTMRRLAWPKACKDDTGKV